ncbi:calcium-binding protein [Albimonas sp. CAU 1670]|uniref:calcium-binding protein n=1 Tax=Albimonas sp. CAU 1670 TaxID=3032599 RepID=UPI0023DBD608|nr:calcium-binding protein [Albimonas sp. CAU 1670]MDF2232491.1 calcium-binding protein [Albimonas sp. CAU 1670]
MPGGKAKLKHFGPGAGTFMTPGEILLRIYGAGDYDETFDKTSKKTGVLTLTGDGFVAVIKVKLDKRGRPDTVKTVELQDADGTPLARASGMREDIDDFFDDLDDALAHLDDGDLDGALHHIARAFGSRDLKVLGTGARDVIMGADGDDVVKAKGGDDAVLGTEGADKLNGGGGSNGLYYGTLDVGTKQAGVKADLGKGKAKVDGETQKLKNFQDLGGTEGRDELHGDDRGNIISGRGGDDSIDGHGGDDFIYGGDGADDLFGSAGADYLEGGAGTDTVRGGSGADNVYGGDGADTVDGQSGADNVDGGAGNDSVSGGSGNDTVAGGEGDDLVRGGSGNDTVFGGDGDDTVMGDGGADRLTGGAGADEFRLDSTTGADTVTDFETGTDKIRANVPFAELTFTDVPGGTEIRTSGGDLVGTVEGVDAATLNDADNFL